ncbi:uncharacterized protein LOC111707592 isoform X2 [Eurytemora carolleeae]|uniref:uncharacterized protein LOC111707592 isoform X2 n=1 Tax=Eurytemora carolleeae TaxID=1294199 RepID=UPI000C77E211|nr:uncharacterized protein LOC111707592 isoform X2 [Eurytemora carolleeae]|eukprot:XP_023336502.1 uncharacterized protein LOC111707592 isoform X2 [Eurytemora affinis]
MSLRCFAVSRFTKHLVQNNSFSTQNPRIGVRSLGRCTALASDKHLLEEHSLKVPSFGGVLWVNSEIDTVVRPINSMEDMQMDKALVKVYGVKKEDKENLTFDVRQEGHKLSVKGSIEDQKKRKNLNCIVEVPLVHNVNVITSGDARIDCKDMVESNYCHLTSDAGEIKVRRVKTANLICQSESGDIVCKGAIQGSISIVTGDGNVVNDKRFIGPTLDISTDSGDIRVASSYSDQSKFSTNTGNLFLRNIHNESYVAIYEKGNLTMLGIDGSTNVFVKKGDIDVQVSKVTHESRIHVENGDIVLKIADNFPLKVCVTAAEIILDTKFRKYGEISSKDDDYKHYFGTIQPEKFSPTLQVISEQGQVIVESQDWAASLGFKLPDTA